MRCATLIRILKSNRSVPCIYRKKENYCKLICYFVTFLGGPPTIKGDDRSTHFNTTHGDTFLGKYEKPVATLPVVNCHFFFFFFFFMSQPAMKFGRASFSPSTIPYV